MGKKSGRSSSTTAAAADADATPNAAAAAFVLKVPMHCRCDGCGDKIRAAVKDLALRCEGVVSLDSSALAARGELAVVATADPERLRRRLRKATGKDVGLVFPKPPAAAAADGGGNGKDATTTAAAASVQALLLAGLQHQQQQQQAHAVHGQPVPAAAAWNALQQHGAYGHAAAYPWVVQQQQAPEPYFGSYYPAAPWGAYPHHGDGGGWLGY